MSGPNGPSLAHGAADQFAVAVDALELHDAGWRRLFSRLEGALCRAHESAFGFKLVQDAAQFGLVFDRDVEAARDVALGAMAGVLLEIVEDHLACRAPFLGASGRAGRSAHASSAVAFFAGLGFAAAFLAAGFLARRCFLSPVVLALLSPVGALGRRLGGRLGRLLCRRFAALALHLCRGGGGGAGVDQFDRLFERDRGRVRSARDVRVDRPVLQIGAKAARMKG